MCEKAAPFGVAFVWVGKIQIFGLKIWGLWGAECARLDVEHRTADFLGAVFPIRRGRFLADPFLDGLSLRAS